MQATLEALTRDHDTTRAKKINLQLTENLNSHQLLAYHHNEGPLLVLAGAGSGKTTVLTRRVARMLSEGMPAEKIFVATFTKKAADEMTSRLTALLGESGPAMVEKLWIGTFHSHCLRILKTEWALLHGKAAYFQIADEHWQKRVARAILGDREWLAKGLPAPPFGMNISYDPKSALSAVSAVKNRGYSVESAEAAFRDNSPTMADAGIQTLVRFWHNYEMAKDAKFDLLSRKPSRRLDFDDLLIETLKLLQSSETVRLKYQQLFTMISIDETQDTSAVQWEIARLMTSTAGNIFIVGDIGQAIYSFRGADPNSTVAQFTTAYPDGDIVRLPTNYRSSATIVRVANELIEKAGIDDRYRLQMLASQDEGCVPTATMHVDADAEAEWLACELLKHQEEGTALHDCAILFRTNAYSRAFEETLIKHGVPYRLEGALGFYGRKEIRDLSAFLHLSVERESRAAAEAAKRILNVPSKKFGKPTHYLGGAFSAQVEIEAAHKRISFYKALTTGQFKTAQGLAVRDFRDMVKAVADAGDSAEARLRKARELGYDDFLLREEGHVEEEGNSRLDNLEELCVSSQAFPSAKDYLNFILAQQQTAGQEPAGDYVEMMTVHRAKGLEWDIVFVVGFAQGMIPHHRSIRWFDEEKKQLIPDSIEEERRLAYVALTRAKRIVYLSWPQQHLARALTRSPFLDEMPSLGLTARVEADENDPPSI
jgi:DNA helicase-2/ATP-dependent DNA helicase PcrA